MYKKLHMCFIVHKCILDFYKIFSQYIIGISKDRERSHFYGEILTYYQAIIVVK